MNLNRLFNIIIDKLKNKNIGLSNEIESEKWILSKINEISPGTTFLDAGAGQQRFKKFCTNFKYFSQDFCEYNINNDNRGLHVGLWDYQKIDIVSDICKIPIESEFFDSILCTEVFEHIPEPIEAIKEFHRLLKPKGKLILSAPFCSLTHFAPHHYYSGFNKYFYNYHLNKIGYNIIEIKENGNFFEFLAQELRRINHISSKYTDYKASIFDKKIINQTLNLLEKISKRDSKSSETLCFSYLVLAEKK